MKSVRLLKAHTDAGRDYQAGEVLPNLDDIAVAGLVKAGVAAVISSPTDTAPATGRKEK